MDKQTRYMQRAIALAEQARGKCSPNPFVGALIVKNDSIIGEGFTQAYGCDHAEVQAIKNSSQDCYGAEIYVTLEPCSHYGKTPPCAKAIIESGIKAVYIGITDPNTLVNGKGIQMLKDAGIKVESGFCADIITQQLEYYLTYITKRRPFVILKTATTLDGRIAAEDGSSRWISCEEARAKTHELRQEADVVLTGIGTILKDNPLLNVRLPHPYKQPLRVILDSHLSMPVTSNIALTATEYPTLILTLTSTTNPEKEKALQELGIEICHLESDTNQLDLTKVLSELHHRKKSLIMVEAGNRINTSFLQAGLVDKLYVFIAPKLLGGNNFAWNSLGISNITQAMLLNNMKYEQIGTDILVTAYPATNK
jgi:diaminohydroxyphosphoribosylaminopyrimidine deaminase/5-amino-6-(5-phosphoribosylamino)uracil reductase